jgi:hypothetical protein
MGQKYKGRISGVQEDMHKAGRLSATLVGAIVLSLNTSFARQPEPRFRSLLHAHNCYPEDGKWADRLERALGTHLSPIAIEQDLVWSPANGQSMVSHGLPLTGTEPTLDEYFFTRLTPILDGLLREPRPETWPAIILHLDFKTNEPEHHRAIWELLGRYERFLTTAVRQQDDQIVQPMRIGPLLVLTENGAGQARDFHDEVPVGERLRLFGTVPSPALPNGGGADAQAEAAIHATPATLIPTRATNYQRWTNSSWLVVERGGQAGAGDWTSADATRLASIVNRAHESGLWIRFYTLNGHAPDAGLGWSASYNFGSLETARIRWRAAIAAGVDFIATDQYEEFARERRSDVSIPFAKAPN